jgi:hypothetical protein
VGTKSAHDNAVDLRAEKWSCNQAVRPSLSARKLGALPDDCPLPEGTKTAHTARRVEVAFRPLAEAEIGPPQREEEVSDLTGVAGRA